LLFITSRDIVFSMSVYVSVVTKKWSVLEICLVVWTTTDKWLQVFWQAESERLFWWVSKISLAWLIVLQPLEMQVCIWYS